MFSSGCMLERGDGDGLGISHQPDSLSLRPVPYSRTLGLRWDMHCLIYVTNSPVVSWSYYHLYGSRVSDILKTKYLTPQGHTGHVQCCGCKYTDVDLTSGCRTPAPAAESADGTWPSLFKLRPDPWGKGLGGRLGAWPLRHYYFFCGGAVGHREVHSPHPSSRGV